MTGAEALKFFAIIFRGEHHIPGKVEAFGMGWSVVGRFSLATYDGDLLTRLVLCAHKHAYRVEVQGAGGFGRLRIAVWKRKRRGSMDERHPDIQSVISGNPEYQ
jgi:hypothetical protein